MFKPLLISSALVSALGAPLLLAEQPSTPSNQPTQPAPAPAWVAPAMPAAPPALPAWVQERRAQLGIGAAPQQ